MGFFNFFQTKDINAGIKEFLAADNALLLDVRTEEEYAEGHIAHSKNIPLQYIEQAKNQITDKGTPLFVYCRSGARSAQATESLKKAGYTNVNNIGGILSYRGEVVK